MLITILATIGGAGVLIVGLAAWLRNVWASRIRDSEKARSDLEIEVLKASLEIQKVRFDTLHAKRAEILSELYEHIYDAYIHTWAMAGKIERDIGIAAKSAETALDSIRKAVHLLESRKIWLSKALSNRVSSLLTDLQRMLSQGQSDILFRVTSAHHPSVS